MGKIMRCWVSLAMVSVLLAGLAVLAEGKDKAKKHGDKPPGWEKGEKKGWKGGEVPPGQRKKKIEESRSKFYS